MPLFAYRKQGHRNLYIWRYLRSNLLIFEKYKLIYEVFLSRVKVKI